MEFMENILITNNNVVCKFCSRHCVKVDRDRKRYWWWDCKVCNVKFLVSIKGGLDSIQFESKEEHDRFYRLHVLISQKKTEIYVLNKEYPAMLFGFNKGWQQQTSKPYYVKDLVVSFDQVMDITPTNFQNKLKTYLILL